MHIKHWPEAERPREKLFSVGAEALSTTELLAILLQTGRPGQSAVDLARTLLKQFGSLGQLKRASEVELAKIPGMGKAKMASVKAAFALCGRLCQETLQQQSVLNHPLLVEQWLVSTLAHREREVFMVLFLNRQYQLIAHEELFQGGLSAAAVYPREVMKATLKHNASAIILCHNHPSGDPNPSLEDRTLTQSLSGLLKEIEVTVLDHVIIGAGKSFSFLQAGLL